MVIAQLFDLFIIFSFIGWIFECGYCTFKGGHWQNRGFLYGPVCPIYGCGVVLALVVFTLLPTMQGSASHPLWEIFLVCAVGSAILEFTTSVILEKFFHALWWDYSDMPLNLQGRICAPATCGFGLAGIVIVRFLIPFLNQIAMDQHVLLNEFLCLAFALVMGMDLALTVASLTRILERMESVEMEFNDRMETGYRALQQGPAAVYTAAKGAAISAGETAVIAAMLATDAAREQAERSGIEMSERVRGMMENFSMRERYHLRSIKIYRPVHKKGERPDTSERMRNLFLSLQEKARERVVRHQDSDE